MTLHIIKKCKLNYRKYNNILNIKIKIFFYIIMAIYEISKF